MSLLASIISAATLLGGPAEVYAYGTMYVYWGECIARVNHDEDATVESVGAAWVIGAAFTAKLFIPIFRRIGHISIYAVRVRLRSPMRYLCVVVPRATFLAVGAHRGDDRFHLDQRE